MLTAVAERVRATIVPVDKKLADALDEVRRRQARYDEIKAGFARRASVGYFVAKLRRAQERYGETQADEDLEAACLAEIILERAKQRAGIAEAQISAGVADDQFRREFPNNRELLIKACGLKLKIAKAELERVTAMEQKRLSAEGFEADEIAQSLQVKRARHAVERSESLLESLKTATVENLWRNLYRALFE